MAKNNESYVVSLNGITANIVRADVLLSSGVIHVLDDALWNLTPVQSSGVA